MKHYSVLITLFFSISNAVFGEPIVLPAPPFDSTKTYQVEMMDESDLGFLNNKDIMEGILIGIPYVDFVVKF